jgi:hypothetical protein
MGRCPLRDGFIHREYRRSTFQGRGKGVEEVPSSSGCRRPSPSSLPRERGATLVAPGPPWPR